MLWSFEVVLVLVDVIDGSEQLLDASEDVSSDDVLVRDLRFRWGIHELVGHGEVGAETCGHFKCSNGCLGQDGSHDRVDVYGHDFRDKVAIQSVFMRCYSPRCPTCYRTGWAMLVAERGTGRLLEASKKFGLVEHGTASVPLRDYDRLLSMSVKEFKAYWRYVEGLLARRGVIGGVSMFHPVRYNPVDGWHWSPHFHFLGVLVPSYGLCRRCVDKVCLGRNREFERCKVKGFEAVTRRENLKDGFIVKIFGRRGKAWKTYFMDGEKVRVAGDEDNIFGTLSYQLSHAGLVVGSKRASVVHWFGVCSYRALKVTVARRKQLCPICDEEFVQIRRLNLDVALPDGCGVHVVDGCGADGEPYYVEMFGGSYR
jgi:hypothetical protein